MKQTIVAKDKTSARKIAEETIWNYISVGWMTSLLWKGAKVPLQDAVLLAL
jgi:hypothetical protein